MTATATKPPPPKNEDTSIVEFAPFATNEKIKLSVEIVRRLIAVKTKSGKTCSDEDAIRFIMMCQARKLNPFEGDAFLIGYDSREHPDNPTFSLITAHQAFLKRAELHPQFDGMESGTIVQRGPNQTDIVDLLGDWHMQGDKVLGGWATVYFKNRSKPMHKRLRVARFAKNFGIWQDDPAGMIVKCAEADALRSSFPTMLGGLHIREEMPDQHTIEIPSAKIAEVVEPPKTPEPGVAKGKNGDPIPPATEKKKLVESSSPTPERSSQSTSTRDEPTPARSTEKPAAAADATVASTNRDRLKSMLALGACSPAEFMQIAINYGWFTADQTFDDIPDARVNEFVKMENFEMIMSIVDEHRAKADAPAKKAATKGDRLL